MQPTRTRSRLAAQLLMAAAIAMPSLGQQTSLAARPNQPGEVITPPTFRRPTRQEREAAQRLAEARLDHAEARRQRRGQRNIRNAWLSSQGHFCPQKRMALLDFFSADASRLFAAQAQSEDWLDHKVEDRLAA